MTKKAKIQTRKEDALSIVEDAELVEDIDKTNALEAKSDILVEMSDTDEEVETPLVEDSKPKDVEEEDSEEDMEEGKPKDKKKMKEETKKSLTTEDVVEIIKATLKDTFSEKDTVSEPVEVASQPIVENSALDKATDELYNSVKFALSMKGASFEQRIENINPALQELGNSISALVRESMGVLAPAPVSNEQGQILEAISVLTQKIDGVATEVATMKAQTTNVVTVPSRVPVPRSIQPQVVLQSHPPVNPNSVANIVRRSVSTNLPLK